MRAVARRETEASRGVATLLAALGTGAFVVS
jgi:hypothetical protein